MVHLAKDTQEDMLKLNQVYLLEEYFGSPDRYPRTNVVKFKLEYGRTFWSEYLCGAIKNIYSIIEGNKVALKSFVG